jgi:hypothetical protein
MATRPCADGSKRRVESPIELTVEDEPLEVGEEPRQATRDGKRGKARHAYESRSSARPSRR